VVFRKEHMEGRLDNLRVVLAGTRNPLNIGAAARAMSNFGARHLRLVQPYEVAFREARSAVGAAAVMAGAVEFKTVAEAVADCRLVVGTTAAGRRELQHELRRLEVGGRAIRKQLASGPVALLFGSEKRGLSNDDMSHCHWLMRIPTRGEQDQIDHDSNGSMNLGQAVAVCLYELARAGKVSAEAISGVAKDAADGASARKPKVNALVGDLERITNLLLEVLDASGYVKPRLAGATEEKLRRMVRRMNLSEKDAKLWLGILRQIGWRLGAKGDGSPD